MRKTSLVKAMACFMAATMAITCVPSANVTNGVSIVAEAAEAVTVSEPIVNYDFADKKLADTSSRALGDVTLTAGAEATDDGIKITNGHIELSDKLFSTLTNETKGITVVITYKKEASSWPDSQWAEPLAGFGTATDSKDKKEFRIQANGNVGMFDNGTEIFYSGQGSWADGGLDYTYEKWHTTAVTYDFEKNEVVVYQDGKKISNSSEAKWDVLAKLSVKDFKSFTNNHIGIVPYGWCMWGHATISNFSVYDSALTEKQVVGVTPINHCKDITFAEENTALTVDVPATLTAKVEGETAGKNVTDVVTATAIDADIKIAKEFDGQEYVLSVTPTKVTTQGAVTVKCGSVEKTYNFTAEENTVKTLECENGTAFSAPINQVAVFSMKATATNEDICLKDMIEVVTGSALVVDTESTRYTGYNGLKVLAKLHEGSNVFGFKCADKTLEVVVTGVNNSVAVVPSTPSTPGTTTPDSSTTVTPDDSTTTTTDGAIDTTPDAATDGAIDTKPEDKPATTPDDSTTTTPDETPVVKPDDTPATTPDDSADEEVVKKSKVKVSGLKAVKAKKVVTVSGKATKKATVKVTAAGKTLKTTAKNGKFSVSFSKKVSKKIKKNTKIKVVVTKNGYKKVTKTVKVK